MFQTPILFLVFNRLNTTKQVFAKIREVKPSQLFVASDGPRTQLPDEKDKIEEIRQFILANIDWECELNTLFRDSNLGCGLAVSSAIDWFFEHVEQGIILEDDTLPENSFFTYCELLLNYYKEDTRVGLISGNNFNLVKDTTYSYLYTKYVSIWGWATWRRAWKLYDFKLQLLKQQPEMIEDLLKNKFCQSEYSQRKVLFDNIINSKMDTWDYQWFFCCLVHHLLTIIPTTNLISNIGFNKDATHTIQSNIFANLPTNELKFPLKHPPFCLVSERYEEILNASYRNENEQSSLLYKWSKKLKTW